MTYTPNNVSVYLAAFVGVLAGAGFSTRAPLTGVSGTANAALAAAFAQDFDTAWGGRGATTMDVSLIQAACEAEFNFSGAAQPTPAVGTFTGVSTAIIAIVNAAEANLTANGISTGAATASGVFQNAPALFVDWVNGNDTNAGTTAGSAVKTHAQLELRRRAYATIANYNGSFPILQNTTVTVLTVPPTPATDPINFDVARLGSFQLSYVFASTTLRAGVLGAVTPRSGTQWWQVGSTFVAGDVGALVLDTTSGSCAFVQAVAGGLADTSEWITTQAGPITGAASPPALVAPNIADGYAVQTLGRVKFGRVSIKQVGAAGGTFLKPAVLFYRFQYAADAVSGFGIPDSSFFDTDGAGGSNVQWCACSFTECMFEGTTSYRWGSYVFYNCYFGKTILASNTAAFWYAGACNGVIMSGADLHFDDYNLQALDPIFSWGIGNSQASGSPSLIFLGRVMIYKQTSGASYFATDGTTFVIQSSHGALSNVQIAGQSRRGWEISNGCRVQKAAGITWVNAIPCTFSAQMADVDGLVAANAVSFDTTALVLGATPITITAAALDTTIGSGGFGGFAVNPGTNTRFAPAQT